MTVEAVNEPAVTPPVFHCGRYTLALNRPLVMGIVNVTPDSFSDGGQFVGPQAAIDHAVQLVRDGADMLDIGGESTRPGADPVSAQQELDRIMPVVQAVISLNVPISVDTRRPEVMRDVLQAGVDLINDVNGFRDSQSLQAVAASTCGVCIMHMLGEPRTMQQHPHYGDVVREVTDFLITQRDALLAMGVAPERILIDPGFGFGKTLEHNLRLMRHIHAMAALQPVLVGVSRKSMIGALTDQTDPAQRVAGSVAAALYAADQGAQVLRVHDVRETVDALKVWAALKSRNDS